MCDWRRPEQRAAQDEKRLRRSHDQSALRPLNDWSVMAVAVIEILHFNGLEFAPLAVTIALVVLAIVLAAVWR